MKHKICSIGKLILITSFLSTPAISAATTVELTAEANQPAANDLVRATVSAEASGTAPGDLAKQINKLTADALKTAKAYTSVKTQSGSISTYPIYSKGGKIESWRMRSDLILESRDPAAMSDLLGRLQSSLGVSSLVLLPSPETRKTAENEAILNAIGAFKVRAKVIADALGQHYHIKQLSVNTSGRSVQPMYRAVAKSMLSEPAPMPLEAGESEISVNVSGQIELE